MMREIQREFDKHPIRVPIEADDEALIATAPPSTNYFGPVINVHGDHAQLAWNNETVNQGQSKAQEIAPGFEAIAQAVVSTLRALPSAGLTADDLDGAQSAANEALAEVTKPQPDRGVVRRAIAALKGFLTPVALGISVGTAEGAQEWARAAIEQLGVPFS